MPLEAVSPSAVAGISPINAAVRISSIRSGRFLQHRPGSAVRQTPRTCASDECGCHCRIAHVETFAFANLVSMLSEEILPRLPQQVLRVPQTLWSPRRVAHLPHRSCHPASLDVAQPPSKASGGQKPPVAVVPRSLQAVLRAHRRTPPTPLVLPSADRISRSCRAALWRAILWRFVLTRDSMQTQRTRSP